MEHRTPGDVPADSIPWIIEPLRLPETVDSADAADFIAANDLSNLTEGLRWGNNDHWVSAENRLAGDRSSEYTARQSFIAKADGRLIGRADVELPLADNTGSGYVYVIVHPEYQRRGLGSQLYAALENHMLNQGRTVALSWSDHVANFDVGAPEGLQPGSGPGSLPRKDPVVQFCRSLGYRLEQVERFGLLQLPIDDSAVTGLKEKAQRAAGDDYELVTWQDRCPDAVVDQYSYLCQRMSVDIPLGELQWQAEQWDAARVRKGEDKLRQQGGHSLVAVARHVPSGQLVGNTVLEYFPDRPEVAYQENTLVLQAHRGHRLGMLLKAANLLRLQDLRPQVRRLYTWNAAENSHMLSINIELGFTPAGYVGAWQKKLS